METTLLTKKVNPTIDQSRSTGYIKFGCITTFSRVDPKQGRVYTPKYIRNGEIYEFWLYGNLLSTTVTTNPNPNPNVNPTCWGRWPQWRLCAFLI